MLWSERAGTGPRLVLVHGFTQNRRCWGPVADALAEHHEVVLIDAPGHGRSSDVPAGLRTGARLIADSGGAGTYLGYSMGGRYCLHVALAHPELVRGLVLIGATAGIEDPQERSRRRASDEALATRLESIGLEAFLDEWLGQPLFAGLSAAAQARDERLEGSVEGLATSLRLAGTGSQDPLWPRLHRLGMPVLVVAGERDDRYAALAQRLVEGVGGNAERALVPGAGHAAHLEDPQAFLAVILPWLERHGL